MKINKKSFTVLLCTIFCVSLFAQEQSVVRKSSTTENKKTETSVEQEYLSDVDGVVILSLAASDEYDNKLVAMQFLESAVENGNTSEDIMKALNQLAGEGISKQSRTNGRLMNNYPDIRRRACLALGKYEICSEDLYVVVQEYETREEGLLEVHNKYIDIQCMVEGIEKIYYAQESPVPLRMKSI